MSTPKYSKWGPEADTLDEYKGKLIRVWPVSALDVSQTWIGRLEYVDMFTYGFAFDRKNPTSISVLQKSAISRLDPILNTAPDGAERDNSDYGNASKG